VDRRDHRFIGEHCIDMGHPRLLQIFDLSRDEPITQGCSTLSSWTGESEMQQADANRRRVAA
jgi:hypothetical protein